MRRLFFPKMMIWLASLGLCLLANALTILAAVCKGRLLDVAMEGAISRNGHLIFQLLLAVALASLGSFAYNALRWTWIEHALKHLRDAFFSSLLRRPYRSFLALPEGEILAKYSQQIGQLENEFYLPLGRFSQMLIQVLAVSAALFRLNAFLAALSIFCCSLAFLAPKLLEKRVSAASDARRLAFERHAEKIQSWLSHFEVIKNYRIEAIIARRFQHSMKEYRDADWEFERLKSVSGGFGFLASLGARSAVLFCSGCLVYRGQITVGLFYSVMALVDSLGPALYWLSKLYQDVLATRPIRQSLASFIQEGEKEAAEGTVRLDPKGSVSVHYDHVSAAYGERILFREADLHFHERGVYLLQGPSGCGKSSAIRLLLGIDEALSGQVCINGYPVGALANRREIITVVQQEACLLQSSLRDNLTLYREYPENELFRVLAAVGLERLADRDCLNQEISENGANLSGGEKKRLSLARALLRRTPILILDEPLANVDPANVERIEDLIFSLKEQLILVISHQFSEAKLNRFRAIYDFKDGRIVPRNGGAHA